MAHNSLKDHITSHGHNSLKNHMTSQVQNSLKDHMTLHAHLLPLCKGSHSIKQPTSSILAPKDHTSFSHCQFSPHWLWIITWHHTAFFLLPHIWRITLHYQSHCQFSLFWLWMVTWQQRLVNASSTGQYLYVLGLNPQTSTQLKADRYPYSYISRTGPMKNSFTTANCLSFPRTIPVLEGLSLELYLLK